MKRELKEQNYFQEIKQRTGLEKQLLVKKKKLILKLIKKNTAQY